MYTAELVVKKHGSGNGPFQQKKPYGKLVTRYEPEGLDTDSN
jgi:hypothetical protein